MRRSSARVLAAWSDKTYREAIRLMKAREVAHNLGTMAALERDAGQLPADTLAALRRMCERLERRPDLDSADFYSLACYHALRYRLAKSRREGSAGVDTQEPPPTALDRAVVALRRAIDSGWTDADWTERDPDLVPLHDRDDYRQLIAELRDRTFPADPFAR